MRLPFFLPRPSGFLLEGVNALLKREAWAREQLAAHAGKSLRVAVGEAWNLRASVASDGLFQACDEAIVPDVILSVPRDRLRELPGVWREQGLAGVTGLTRIEGDASLAQVLSELARSLRWDVEDDLSRVVGDVLAVRLVAGARQLASGARAAARRAQENLSEYLGDESGIGVPASALGDWSERRQGLANRLDALESRLRRLEHAC